MKSLNKNQIDLLQTIINNMGRIDITCEELNITRSALHSRVRFIGRTIGIKGSLYKLIRWAESQKLVSYNSIIKKD